MHKSLNFAVLLIVGFVGLYGIYSNVDSLRTRVPVLDLAILFGFIAMIGFIGLVYSLRKSPMMSKRLR